MRTDKELHDEAMAGEGSRLGTEDIANANPRVDPDAHRDDMTVTGTRVDGRADQDMRQEMRDGDTTDQEMRDGDTTDLDMRDDVSDSDLDTRDERPMTERAPEEDIPSTTELFPRQEVERFRVEWQEIQTRFVDDPHDSVQNADRLVAEVMRSLATTFTNHKHDLESSWQRGDKVETEDLRRALQHYRSFFNQLLEV
jgi:hypothetical protein